MKILAFDANSIVNRAFYGVRPLTTRDGTYTHAVYGFFNITYRLIEEQKPDITVFCFDLHAPTFRHKMYAEYKGTRRGMPEELQQQMPLVKELLRLLGYPIVEAEGYEADDLLGTIARQGTAAGHEVLICTGDRDSLQLIDEHTNVILAASAPQGAQYTRMDIAAVQEKYGVTPLQLIEVKALMGDSSDNIPGVPGIGEKGALALIGQYGNIDYIYQHLPELELTPSLRRKLTEGEASARMSRTLGTICCTAPLPAWEALQPQPRQDGALYLFLSRLELNRLIDRLKLTAPTVMPVEEDAKAEPDAPLTVTEVEADFDLTALNDTLYIAYGCAEEGELNFLALRCGDTVYHFTETTPALWERLFALPNEKVVPESKPLYKAALREGLSLQNLRLDCALAGYLLNPNAGDYTVEHLRMEFGIRLPLSGEEYPLPVQQAAVLPLLAAKLEEEIKEKGQEKLLREIEQPLSEVLASMELVGFRVDIEGVKAFGSYLDGLTAALTAEIYAMAGGEFNLNSPKQLGEVLFERLRLPARKKTKSGCSTSAEVLEELIPEHPIVSKSLDYRKYQKLSSTYVAGLAAAVGKDSRIRSVFHQTETRTGRISSAEPNMQNIPIRTEPGSRMREFFSAEEGFVLVDADYSQIELRVLAALAGDEAMTAAFLAGEDIHTNTAAQVFDLPPAFVTPLMRSRAKAVNFGIVYGIGAYSLSRDIGVTVAEANEYITNYKRTYSGIAAYLAAAVQQAREKGYAETLFGRRRALPELHAGNHIQRAFGERVAMNTPIQGTAADIIKIAMVRVWRRLKKEVPDARLILQVHDELIVEAPENAAEQVRLLVQAEMEHAVSLSVPMVVEAKVGKTWADAH